MEDLSKRIREGRLKKGFSQSRLGELTGVSRSAVNQWESGGTVPDAERLPLIARALEMDAAQLLGTAPEKPTQSNNVASEAHGFKLLSHGDKPPRPLVVYRTSPGEGGRMDVFMLRAERVGETERPDFLRFSEKAFAAKVLDDRNAPAYRRRDVILIDPDSLPIEGEDCIFCENPSVAHGTQSVIGRLIQSTGKLWTIHEYASKANRELPRSEFPNAWLIVGRYNRR